MPKGACHEQGLNFSTTRHLRCDGSKPSRNSRLNTQPPWSRGGSSREVARLRSPRLPRGLPVVPGSLWSLVPARCLCIETSELRCIPLEQWQFNFFNRLNGSPSAEYSFRRCDCDRSGAGGLNLKPAGDSRLYRRCGWRKADHYPRLALGPFGDRSGRIGAPRLPLSSESAASHQLQADVSRSTSGRRRSGHLGASR
jgi:hypothetical protein